MVVQLQKSYTQYRQDLPLQLRTSTCNAIPVSPLDIEAYATGTSIGCKGQNTSNVTKDTVLPAP